MFIFANKRGFIFEDMVVPIDYVVKANTPRTHLSPLGSNASSHNSSLMSKNYYKLEPIRESDFNNNSSRKESDMNRY
jgi:hypothetical protein